MFSHHSFVKHYLKLWPENMSFTSSPGFKRQRICNTVAALTSSQAELSFCFAVLLVNRGIHPAFGLSNQEWGLALSKM